MAVTGDVTIAQDGAANHKLHPYLIALVRWCVSCVWSTASVFLHRLVTTQLPQITGPKQASKPRQAGRDHLHPEPKVESVVLHTPETHTLDVIFMHGLYGSLGNTWRQGDWRSKYKLDPTKVTLTNHAPKPCKCQETQEQSYNTENFSYETNLNETEINEHETETVSFQQINGCFKKILPNENSLITEKFYNNTLLNVNNYETQGNFVAELFKNDCAQNGCDLNNTFECDNKCNGRNKCKCKINESNTCNCKINEGEVMNKCTAGCGCVCDDCYSSCWPRDWLKEDFPGARVISVNYTSDPYLWRPLWVKGCKRLRLHERAEQMMKQLLSLGVGKRPIIWVGHSKGGLFIKQIYCEAYDAYLKLNKDINGNKLNDNIADQSNYRNTLDNNYSNEEHDSCNIEMDDREPCHNKSYKNDKMPNILLNNLESMCNNKHLTKEGDDFKQNTNNLQETSNLNAFRNTEHVNSDEFMNTDVHKSRETPDFDSNEEKENNRNLKMFSNDEEDKESLQTRSSLWRQSAGFMFYSVPHLGSSLAAIKTPITTRSIELLEISKECASVVSLHSRWRRAAGAGRARVRSLVETRRTLMAVLWLTIVTPHSADAGVGPLMGVSVDHREICKPSSRRCPLYTELTELVHSAAELCHCDTHEGFSDI